MTKNEDVENRRQLISEELGVPIEKVHVLPYKPPQGSIWPTPHHQQYQREFIKAEDAGENLTTIYTYYGTKKKQKDVIEWLRNSQTLNEN
jgi:hypothetical protein